ncbi:ExbD/TolR family protein [Microbulbifer thermotolerans]|uniref:Biopolymer transporter ExbD n=1 Tax=Microbulbifer thermotolerans TaxID=252514 RepID=A0A143HJE3_MICTH|nr:biopolymer transporter ExbD [Microbulbifer thermotolerans]AMX01835.1 biopolymer transporter ExbD [Microbulbifer thermotolerans]MCX2835753.1 biopolymer transporter ExbD [Microbulbifer thermotolerans]WKT61359.1 biopolymer transporter ExbD [Microbulbifer thermotolerans]
MRRRHQGRNKEAPELDITAFLNLMVVLVPFLLVSAVFSRVTILELDMPAGAGGGAPDDPTVTVEVVVRKEALEISDGEKVIARFPNLNAGDETAEDVQQDQIDQPLQGEEALVVPPTEEVYDLKKLSQFLLQIKGSYPDKTDSILLMEPDIAYEHLVGVMDAVRGVDVREEGADPDDLEAVEHVVLFPDISIGDAP